MHKTKITLISGSIKQTGFFQGVKFGFIFFLLLPVFIQAQITTWQPPQGFSSDEYYTVKVNGVNVPVYDTPIASYALFDFTGEVNIEVNTMFDVRWVDIRPLRWELKPEYTGDNAFRFSINEPANLSLELNGRIRQQPLFIFAGEPEKDRPSKNDKNVIWFEAGKLYENVKLELEDNQTVYVEGGAVVQGYLFAEGKKNIKVYGRGILDGSLNRATPGNNNRFLDFRDCENITIDGLTLHNGTTWQIATFKCNNVQIANTRLVSESASDDGLDIVRSTNVTVDNVFAHTKDDCVAIKSHLDYPDSYPTDNILVKNCVFWNSIWGNAIEIGFELYSDEVKNIRFENIDIIHVEDGAALSIHNAGGAHVHNVVFENIRIEDARQKLFDVAIFLSQYSQAEFDENLKPNPEDYMHGAWDGVRKVPVGEEKYYSGLRGTVSTILFKDIQVVDGLLPFSVFHGFDTEKNVSDIRIENLCYRGKRIKDLESAKIRQQNTTNLIID